MDRTWDDQWHTAEMSQNRRAFGSRNDSNYMAQAHSWYSGNKDYKKIDLIQMSCLNFESPEGEFKMQFLDLKEGESAQNADKKGAKPGANRPRA